MPDESTRVHDHGPEDGPGLACPERIIDGKLRGACVEPHSDTETVCGMRFVVDHTIPPGEIHLRDAGRTVARLINVASGEVAVGSRAARDTTEDPINV